MKRLLSRTRTQTNWLSSPGFTPRQVTAMAVAVLLAVVLVPVGAQAAQVVSAIITDPAGTNKAHVDASGNLQVAGSVKLANAPLSVTTTDDPGRQAFVGNAEVDFEGGDFAVGGLITGQEGRRL